MEHVESSPKVANSDSSEGEIGYVKPGFKRFGSSSSSEGNFERGTGTLGLNAE